MADQQELKVEGGGGKKKLFIIIGAVVFLLVAGGGAAFALGGSSEPSPEELAAAAKPPADEPGKESASAKEVHYIKFEEPFVIQINAKPRQRMLQVFVAVSTSTEEDLEIAKVHSMLIKSIIDQKLYNADPALYNNMSGRLDVKEACTAAVKEALKEETGKSVIDKVLFTGFVMQ